MDAEWAKLSEQERQARLTKLKLMERRLRKEGKYDEAAALLGDMMKDSDFAPGKYIRSKVIFLAAVKPFFKQHFFKEPYIYLTVIGLSDPLLTLLIEDIIKNNHN